MIIFDHVMTKCVFVFSRHICSFPKKIKEIRKFEVRIHRSVGASKWCCSRGSRVIPQLYSFFNQKISNIRRWQTRENHEQLFIVPWSFLRETCLTGAALAAALQVLLQWGSRVIQGSTVTATRKAQLNNLLKTKVREGVIKGPFKSCSLLGLFTVNFTALKLVVLTSLKEFQDSVWSRRSWYVRGNLSISKRLLCMLGGH